MDEKDLKIIRLEDKVEDLISINHDLQEENARLRNLIDEASDSLYDVYRNLTY
ncbi:MAG: hypothetical protein LBK94_08530 [Prevotellaceae bacterium]|jgi:hypothetical protein|nr:hypothetical protein [Prevotellaceae bacterium]